MAANRRLSHTARALLVSSLGLPGFSELMAAEAEFDGIQYRFTVYDESALPKNALAGGDADRYRINTHQFRFQRELSERFSLTVNGIHESMSGSSPWYVVPDPDRGPLQVMSGATIHETRNEVSVGLGVGDSELSHSITAGYSTENDYDALFASYGGERELGDKHTTLAWGASFSDDRLSPTDAEQYGRIPHADRHSLSASLSLTRILNRNAVLQSGVQVTRHDGYLSDPYKETWVNGGLEFDHRPGSRATFSWTTRFRQHVARLGASIHTDYRYFRDDWKISAHTLDFAWIQPLGERFELSPSIRYHSQNAAHFYMPAVIDGRQPEYWSSDYRLATFGAMRYRITASWREELWSASLNADVYQSRESLALSGVKKDTPGLVDYWRISLGLRVNW